MMMFLIPMFKASLFRNWDEVQCTSGRESQVNNAVVPGNPDSSLEFIEGTWSNVIVDINNDRRASHGDPPPLASDAINLASVGRSGGARGPEPEVIQEGLPYSSHMAAASVVVPALSRQHSLSADPSEPTATSTAVAAEKRPSVDDAIKTIKRQPSAGWL